MSVNCRNKPPLRLSVEHNANYNFELGFFEIYIERKSCDAGWDTIGYGGHHAYLSAQIPGRKATSPFTFISVDVWIRIKSENVIDV